MFDICIVVMLKLSPRSLNKQTDYSDSILKITTNYLAVIIYT